MANPSVTVSASGTTLSFSGSGIQNDTITLPSGTSTVTLTQGSGVTLVPTLTLPSGFSTNVTISPSSVTADNGEYLFTCTNNITSGGSAVMSPSFTVTATVDGTKRTATVGESELKAAIYESALRTGDPTMIFNPPD